MLVLEQSLYRDATTSIQEKQLEHLQSQLNTADVKVSIADQDYTGKQVRPRKFITATLNGNDVSNQFEIVSYGENVEAGTGTVVRNH